MPHPTCRSAYSRYCVLPTDRHLLRLQESRRLFAFEHVDSISYTSVLQRTFNLNIAYRQPPLGGDSVPENLDSAAIQEVESSMLDQADFPGIDAYVRRHDMVCRMPASPSHAESGRATKKANAANAN
ncbi:hypothetical protein A1O3_06101 [Capronia epimyces CBS 606.96]|uniref:Histone chaperone RTT106/FACT complex subunit SPT16-like middle domain-containing protein n=1 Tax=Capronia epimyces CBS 606.96 TaxID=1182542 RepID=W9XPY2_9EURO|nr:uncharacterized protein A1O3_06101 [Capronia epimyces CBS 606.96]EXJ82288.1 hypothetical protein A1O3_06101 [Capronia epimyces CBS 606.96]